jgi:hypothetical protein
MLALLLTSAAAVNLFSGSTVVLNGTLVDSSVSEVMFGSNPPYNSTANAFCTDVGTYNVFNITLPSAITVSTVIALLTQPSSYELELTETDITYTLYDTNGTSITLFETTQGSNYGIFDSSSIEQIAELRISSSSIEN